MPIKQNAKKALRKSLAHQARNAQRLATIAYAIKMASGAVKEKNIAEAKKWLTDAQQKLDKAARKGTLKPNTAARRISKIAKAVNTITS